MGDDQSLKFQGKKCVFWAKLTEICMVLYSWYFTYKTNGTILSDIE